MNTYLRLFLFLSLIAACSNPDTPATPETPGTKPTSKSLGYSIIREYPHDTSSFTQGLTFYKGELYEGTGEYGQSKLMKVDLNTGKVRKSISLDKQFFGEGITFWGDSIFQLTWQEGKVFVYDAASFKKLTEFPLNTEGWGITTNGKELIVSDGSSNLYFYDPASFKLLRNQGVYDNGELSYNLNELEFIDGFVYANQWNMPYILKIDPASGNIVGKIDLGIMWQRIRAIDPNADVPNGIAYDSVTKKTYITGKRWPSLFEVQISQ